MATDAPVMRQDSPQTTNSNQPFGAQIIQNGITERSLFFLVLFILGLSLIVSIWALDRAGGAEDQSQRAWDRAALAERESRLAQEDLIMLRAAVRQHGIPADGAGDH